MQQLVGSPPSVGTLTNWTCVAASSRQSIYVFSCRALLADQRLPLPLKMISRLVVRIPSRTDPCPSGRRIHGLFWWHIGILTPMLLNVDVTMVCCLDYSCGNLLQQVATFPAEPLSQVWFCAMLHVLWRPHSAGYEIQLWISPRVFLQSPDITWQPIFQGEAPSYGTRRWFLGPAALCQPTHPPGTVTFWVRDCLIHKVDGFLAEAYKRQSLSPGVTPFGCLNFLGQGCWGKVAFRPRGIADLQAGPLSSDGGPRQSAADSRHWNLHGTMICN